VGAPFLPPSLPLSRSPFVLCPIALLAPSYLVSLCSCNLFALSLQFRP
jgi:hypothetical protein